MMLSNDYIAGIVDGEGSISINKRSSRKCYEIGIRVSMVDKQIPEYLFNTFGGSLFSIDRTAKGFKLVHCWCLSRKDEIANFLYFISPSLVLKSKHAQIMTQYINLGSGKGLAAKETFVKRTELFNAISNLQIKGAR